MAYLKKDVGTGKLVIDDSGVLTESCPGPTHDLLLTVESDCAGLDGKTRTMVWDPVFHYWQAADDDPGECFYIATGAVPDRTYLGCECDGWYLYNYWPECNTDDQKIAYCECDPFELRFGPFEIRKGYPPAPCCDCPDGTLFDIVITDPLMASPMMSSRILSGEHPELAHIRAPRPQPRKMTQRVPRERRVKAKRNGRRKTGVAEQRAREAFTKRLAICRACDRYPCFSSAKCGHDDVVKFRTRPCPAGKWDDTALPIAMTMAPRPTEPEIQGQCVASLLATGFDKITIFAEPGTEIPAEAEELPIVQRTERLGEWRNWLHAMSEMLLRFPDADFLASCQDDIVFCQHASELFYRMVWPDERCGCLHLYTSARYKTFPAGIQKLSAHYKQSMAAACFLVFKRDAVAELVYHGLTQGWRGHTSMEIRELADKQGLDTFIGEGLHKLNWDVYIVQPSLAKTIAMGSTLGHAPGAHGVRQASQFPGEDADALEIGKHLLPEAAGRRKPRKSERWEPKQEGRTQKQTQYVLETYCRHCKHDPCLSAKVENHDRIVALGSTPCPEGKFSPVGQTRWITNAQRLRDIESLISMVPTGVTAVAGIPRSGMTPAALIAERLHLWLYALHEDTGLVSLPVGWRMENSRADDGILLIVDDTVGSGRALSRLEEHFPKDRAFLKATVYCNPLKRYLVDICAHELFLPHYLEWCFFNSPYVSEFALDFDGVICPEQPRGTSLEDRERFMAEAPALYLPKQWEVPFIITWRHERYREVTKEWLRRHEVKYRTLVMYDGAPPAPAEYARRVAEWKSEHVATLPVVGIVESDDWLAGQIHERTGKLTIALDSGKVYQ